MERLCFRADANSSVGYGHVVRSGALAGALKEYHGLESVLWTRTPVTFDPFMEQRLIGSDVPVDAEAEWIARQPDRPSVVILDLRRPSMEQIAGYGRGRPWRVVCFDDENEISVSCDISVNPSLADHWPHRKRQTGRYLVGGPFLLLRRQFEQLPPHETRPLPAECLLCFGGSDDSNLSGRIVTAWSQSWPAGVRRVTLVLGPGYEGERTIRRATEADPRWWIMRSPTAMARLMQVADVGLFTASTLLYEALATGLPALFLSVNDGQRQEAEVAAKLGAGVDLGFEGDRGISRLSDALPDFLLGDREGVSRRAQTLVDGMGCRRIANEIARLVFPGS